MAALLVVFLAGCGDHAGDAEGPSALSECRPVPQPAVSSIEDEVGKVGKVAAVETLVTDGPADLRDRAHYVAAGIDGRIAVWVFGDDAFKGGSGFVLSADDAARRVSNLGDKVDPVAFALGPGDPDYDDARDCVSSG